MRGDRPRFHLAFPVVDLDACRDFYTRTLGCAPGREDSRWMDFDFYGHQITAHLCENLPQVEANEVDGKAVPVSHFGLVLSWDQWQRVARELQQKHADFLIEPHIRFAGKVGEQATLFLLDPSGNGVELKAFRNPGQLFAREP